MARTVEDLLWQARHAREHSELLRAVGSVRADGGLSWALAGRKMRSLVPVEIEQLESLGNCCADWPRVRVAEGFDPRRLRFNTLIGDIALGRFAGTVRVAGAELATGIYNSTVSDCTIGDEALVRDVRLLANYAIGSHAVLCGCGSIICEGPTTFGNGLALTVGVETGARAVGVFAEIDLETASAIAQRRTDGQLQRAYAAFVNDYVGRVRSSRGIIGRGAVVRDTSQVHNAYLGPAARVENATFVSNTTLLSSPEQPAEVSRGAGVSDSILQWGSRAITFAVVTRSVLMEHARAECHAKVGDSFIGPNTGIGKGEVTSSLVGPFVGFHHQALLIAALWPQGKGNIASGAQVGSNHTGKAPDQELLAGEGLFFGLGVRVKYPADFRQAPYSLIACGALLLPQRMTFPFSLINTPSVGLPDIPPAYNELLPGWMLTHNLYALKRNEAKFRRRSRGWGTNPIEVEVLRPDIVELMRQACRRLEQVPAIRDVYTEIDIDGLGKNFLREASRQEAIAGYRFFIRLFALLGLKERVQFLMKSARRAEAGGVLGRPTGEPRWEYQRRLLIDSLDLRDVAAGLRELPNLLEQAAQSVEASRSKDDERGARIMEDYAAIHPPAAQDELVRETWQETRRLQGEACDLLRILDTPVRTDRPLAVTTLASPLVSG